MLTRHIYLIFECVWPSTRHSEMIFHFKWFHGITNEVHKYSAKNWTQLMIQTKTKHIWPKSLSKSERRRNTSVQVQHRRSGLEFVAHFRRESLCQDSFYRVDAQRPSDWFEFEIRSLLFTFTCQCLRKQFLHSFANTYRQWVLWTKNKKNGDDYDYAQQCSQSQFMIIRHRHTYDSENAARVELWVMHSRQYQSKCDIRFWHSLFGCSGAQYSWHTPRPHTHKADS